MIYLNNAATSWPKPEIVVQTVSETARALPAESGRSAAPSSHDIVAQCRRAVAHHFCTRSENEVIFTSGATHALNLAIAGYVQPGDRVITTTIEHNSVLRPLRTLQRDQGIRLVLLPCTPEGSIDPDDLSRELSKGASLVVVSACSNVTGAVVDIQALVALAHQSGAAVLIDAAQWAGENRLDFKELGADMVAVAGHKGLFGLSGTGVLLLREGVSLDPLMSGGTGIQSQNPFQPGGRPLKYEAGTPNYVGIAALHAGLTFHHNGRPGCRHTSRSAAARLHEILTALDGCTVYGPPPGPRQAGIVSVSLRAMAASDLCFLLQESFGITSRAGLHCAPLIFPHIGAPPEGTLRLSPSAFTTDQEIETVGDALRQVAEAL